jgi:hypothetical protein
MENFKVKQLKKSVIMALIALIPIVLTLLALWRWRPGSFILIPVIMFYGSALAYDLMRKEKLKNKNYRLAVAVAVVTGLVLVWMSIAVGGILGDNPANMMYLGVFLIACVGAGITRLEAHGMSGTLFAVAFAMMLIPAIALLIGTPAFANGVAAVLGLHSVFALMFVGSAILFRRAASISGK